MAVAEALKLREAAKILGVHPNTLRKLNEEGELPGFRYTEHGPWYFTRQSLEQYQSARIKGAQITKYTGKELADFLAEDEATQ